MKQLLAWCMGNASVLSVLVTVGVTVLVVCGLKCSDCSCREKDNLFNRNDL